MIKEFRDFIARDNVIDLAVAEVMQACTCVCALGGHAGPPLR